MGSNRPRPRRWGAVATAVLVAAGVATLPPAAPASAEPPLLPEVRAEQKVHGTGTGLYLVQLKDAPAASYRGGVTGYPATRPGPGRKLDPTDPNVARYVARIAERSSAVLARARRGAGTDKTYDYGYSFAGFAARLTPEEALRAAADPAVAAVSRDERHETQTATTPAFLGLTGPDGFYERFGATGEGVIIGIVDTGIWPEHPSFSDRDANGKLVYRQIPGWHGRCVPGERFNASLCNQKLIGARHYNAGFGGDAGVERDMPYEFTSVRDYDGHGTHTASTAGGGASVPVTGRAAVFGAISGIAPRARIAAYKACWRLPSGSGSCPNSDTVAAIDQAVADGVDVLNYSISGSRTSFLHPVEVAFLHAADAGVFVAASAGNSGPSGATVAHPSPWITTVAAGTHDRDGRGAVTLGDGTRHEGSSLAASAVSAPLVDAADAVRPGASPSSAALCFGDADGGNALDPAKVQGKVVLCDRGATARTNKSAAVQEAGGVGMLLVNVSPSSTNADLHVLPSVHLPHTSRDALKTYAATSGATASIEEGVIVGSAPAPFTATFSSRGPLQASADLLKPDLIAPGQDILAGVSPAEGGRLFDLLSGTSMSSPHVAGLAALLVDLHPDWSPAMVKSALMTSAGDVLDGPAADPAVLFRQGAGHVRPRSAADPGLVLDSGYADWLGFLCGTQVPASTCDAAGVPVVPPSQYNGASIALGALAGRAEVVRTFTNAGTATETYTASTTGLAGVAVTTSPSSLTLAPGQSGRLAVTLTRTDAEFDRYTGGHLLLSGDRGHQVRLPVVVRPVVMAAPAEVTGSYDVAFGYTGPFTATLRGLVPATRRTGSVATGGAVDFPTTVPAGTTATRFSLFDEDVSQVADLDLEVYQAGRLIGQSLNGDSDEQVHLSFAQPLTAPLALTVRVTGFSVPDGAADFTLSSWDVGESGTGTTTLTAPSSATAGERGRIELSSPGLAPGTRYLGSVAYSGRPGLPPPTLVVVRTP